jgi:CDP-paratose synthetase
LDDVIKAVSKSLFAPLSSTFRSFDIGTGKLISIKDFVMLIYEACNSSSILNFGALEERTGELKNSCANLETNIELGWKYETDITEGLKKMILCYKK